MMLSNTQKAGENAVQNFGYLAVYTRFIKNAFSCIMKPKVNEKSNVGHIMRTTFKHGENIEREERGLMKVKQEKHMWV